jgi:hypothetical protein
MQHKVLNMNKQQRKSRMASVETKRCNRSEEKGCCGPDECNGGDNKGNDNDGGDGDDTCTVNTCGE